MATPTKSRTVPLTKRGLNFEMLMWIFTRLSALAMYALILFAIIGALIMGARTQMNLADVLRWGFHAQCDSRTQYQRAGPHTVGFAVLENSRQLVADGCDSAWRAWTGRDLR